MVELVADLVPVLIASASFLFGVMQYARAEQLKREDRRIEAARPFLELQLSLYKQATEAAATLSTSDDTDAIASATECFKRLYFGQLSMVEDPEVEAAMVELKLALDNNGDTAELGQLSLALAHACRNSLAKSWNTSAWLYPGASSTALLTRQ